MLTTKTLPLFISLSHIKKKKKKESVEVWRRDDHELNIGKIPRSERVVLQDFVISLFYIFMDSIHFAFAVIRREIFMENATYILIIMIHVELNRF